MKTKIMKFWSEQQDAKKIEKEVKKRGHVFVIDCTEESSEGIVFKDLSVMPIGEFSSQPLKEVKKGHKRLVKELSFNVFLVYKEPTKKIQKMVDKIGKKIKKALVKETKKAK